MESSPPLHRCRPRPPFTVTVIDELGAPPRQTRHHTTVSCLSGTKTVLSRRLRTRVNLTGREMGFMGGGGIVSPVPRDLW